MPREYRLFLEDIVQAALYIEKDTSGLTLAGLLARRRRLQLVLHNLTVMGEAVKNVPAEIRARYPNVSWRKIAGMRDVISHSYFGLDYDEIWRAVQLVPELRAQIEAILAE